MIPPEVAHILLAVIVGVSITLMLVRPWNLPEVYWVTGGAALLLVLRLIPLTLASKAVAEGSDVYLFLIGMMLLSALANEQGVFEWVSSAAVRGADGSSVRLFTLVYGIGTLTTIFMSNDATAVVLTPAILTAVRKAKVEPLPHLICVRADRKRRFVCVAHLQPCESRCLSRRTPAAWTLATIVRRAVHSFHRSDVLRYALCFS